MVITINTDYGDVHSSQCNDALCFIDCAKTGAIGGICDSSGCFCVESDSQVKKGSTRKQRHTAAEDCDPHACNEVCYQKGGSPGGVCVDNACVCLVHSSTPALSKSLSIYSCYLHLVPILYIISSCNISLKTPTLSFRYVFVRYVHTVQQVVSF